MSGNAPLESVVEGVTVRVATVLTDFDGNTIDGSNVRLLVKAPSTVGNSVVVSTTSGVGNEVVGFIVASEPGLWRYRFESTIPPFVASEGMFYAAARRVPPPI